MANLPQLLQPFTVRRSALLQTLAQTRQSLRHAPQRLPPQPQSAWTRQSPARSCRRAQKSHAPHWPANHLHGRCTPCAPQASATSVRALISNCVPRPANRSHSLERQIFQRSSFQVFLPQLDVLNPRSRALGNLCQQPLLLLLGVPRKLPPVSNVVKLQRPLASIVTAPFGPAQSSESAFTARQLRQPQNYSLKSASHAATRMAFCACPAHCLHRLDRDA